MRQAAFELIYVRGQGPRLKADVGNGVFYAEPTKEMLEQHRVGDLVGEFRFKEGKKIAVGKESRFFLREAELVDRVTLRSDQLLKLACFTASAPKAPRRKRREVMSGSRLYSGV
jgi:hypothetical protein